MDAIETTIRELVAYGDTIGRTGIDLVMNPDARALDIMTTNLGVVTDSAIDDLTDYMDSDAGDMANE